MSIGETFLFVEKYRPTKIDDCILPVELKKQLKEFVQKEQIPNFLFSGSAGVGKTTVAKAIANELNADLLNINASNESGVDTIRTKIVQFASTASFEQNLKIILLDEADHISQSAQAALRAVMEEFHKTTRFILTCNFKNKIIEPLHSRCATVDFHIPSNERKDIVASIFKRVVDILRKENIEFDVKAVASLVQKHFPDFRKVLNEIQRYSVSGKIDAGVLVEPGTTYDELVGFLKDKKFSDVRKWIARNPDLDSQTFFRNFYDTLDVFVPKCTPSIILLLAQYQHMSSQVVDQEINNMAFLVELMGVAEWK